MPTYHHQWETLCLNTFPQVPPDPRVTQEAEHAQISALKYGQFPVAEYPDEQTSLSTRSTEQSVPTFIFLNHTTQTVWKVISRGPDSLQTLHIIFRTCFYFWSKPEFKLQKHPNDDKTNTENIYLITMVQCAM